MYSGRQACWTYQPGPHRRRAAQEFFLRLPSAVHVLIFLARRIQPSLSLVDREVEFCVLTVLTGPLFPLGIENLIYMTFFLLRFVK